MEGPDFLESRRPRPDWLPRVDGSAEGPPSPSSSQPSSFTAGGRLRPWLVRTTSADGASRQELAAWFDTKTGQLCNFEWVEGQLRCLPPQAELAMAPAHTFSDSACRRPVIGVFPPAGDACSPPPRVTHVRLASEDCTQSRLGALGARVRLALEQVYVKGAAGECAPLVVPPGIWLFDGETPLQAMDVLPYVGAHLEISVLANGQRLALQKTTVRGDDGTSWDAAVDLLDTRRSEVCAPSRDALGVERCLPEVRVASPLAFVDSRCTQVAWLLPRIVRRCDWRGPEIPVRYVSFGEASCGALRIFHLPPETHSSSLFVRADTECRPFALDPDSPADVYATPVASIEEPAESFERISVDTREASHERARSGARLAIVQRIVRASGTPWTLPALEFWDSRTSGPCRAHRAQDGKLRCLPDFQTEDEGYSGRLFADAQCRESLVVTKAGDTCHSPVLVAEPRVTATCGAVRLLRIRSDPFEAPVYERHADGRCGPSRIERPRYALYLRRDGVEIPADEFVALEVSSAVSE